MRWALWSWLKVPVAVARNTARDWIIPESAGMSVTLTPDSPCCPARNVAGAEPPPGERQACVTCHRSLAERWVRWFSWLCSPKGWGSAAAAGLAARAPEAWGWLLERIPAEPDMA